MVALLVHRQVLLAHHKLQVVNDHMTDVIQVNGMLHGFQNSPVQGAKLQFIFKYHEKNPHLHKENVKVSLDLQYNCTIKQCIRFLKRNGSDLLDVLLSMEGHEVEWQVLKLVSPHVILIQVLLQPLLGKLGQHNFGQTHIVDFKAAP